MMRPEPAWTPLNYLGWAVLTVILINVVQIITAPGIVRMLGF